MDGLLDPAGQSRYSLCAFGSKFCEAVFDFRRDGWVHLPRDEAVCFERLQGLREHFVTDAADASRQIAESVCSVA